MPNEAMLVPSDQDPTANVLKYGSSKPQMSQISAGGHHSLVLTARGSLYSFGYGSHGQLGLRTTTNQLLPQLVKDLVNKPPFDGFARTLCCSIRTRRSPPTSPAAPTRCASTILPHFLAEARLHAFEETVSSPSVTDFQL